MSVSVPHDRMLAVERHHVQQKSSIVRLVHQQCDADFLGMRSIESGNWQLENTNRPLTHPLPRGGADLMGPSYQLCYRTT